MELVAIRDEVPDDDFTAGWNAYLGNRYPELNDSPEFYEGWTKAYREYNEGKWPPLREAVEE